MNESKHLDTTEAKTKTLEHMKRVQDLLSTCAMNLLTRGVEHDQSKLSDLEICSLQRYMNYQKEHGKPVYGSPEYNQQQGMRMEALTQHFALNRHHPEHHVHGVDDMNLFDLVEMLMDWKAASERDGGELDIDRNLYQHRIDPQLGRILHNTAVAMGFKSE